MTDPKPEAPDADPISKLISQSQESIQANSFLMLRSLDNGQVDETFQKASILVEPLITHKLSPRNYYILYHLVSTALIQLSVAITDSTRMTDRQIAEQYEVVQYHKKALPRLYLMITIGPELATRKVVRILDVIEDVTEMLKQAQDPIHSLFIRHFLLSVFKQHLPDSTPQDRDRSLRFLLANFAQMNRMWVRISDTIRDGKASGERADLSVLVGTNIQRITSLHGLTIENYSQIILPFISKHVELCEDELAQEFILQSIVHAFPEDFHMVTVERLFAVFGRVEQGVKILFIVNQLLDRFLNYVGGLIDPEQGRQMFVTIAKNIEELFNQEGHLALVDKFETLEKLVRFALRINPEDMKNVKNLMKFTQYHIDLAIGNEVLTQTIPSVKLRTLIECPLLTFTNGQQIYGR
jgi:vacuolar protein sorting-associated protein 35